MTESLWRLLRVTREALLCCAVGGLAGFVAGQPLAGLLVGAVGWLCWSLVQQLRLLRWLQSGAAGPTPRSLGLWRSIFAALERRPGEHAGAGESDALLRELFQGFESGVILLDAEGRIEWCNRAAAHAPGARFPEDRGRHLSHLLRTPELLQFLQELPARTPLECPAPGDDARRLRFDCVRLRDGRSAVFVQDVTQERRLERIRRDFVANISHELRTPLTVIVGCLELMEESLPKRKRRALLEDMRAQAGRMSEMVQSLLRLARLESLSERADRERVPLRPLLEKVCNSMRVKAGDGRRLELRCPDGLHLLGSASELQSVFVNLLENAVRHTDAQDGLVQVEAERREDGVQARVRDNGVGIERRHLPRLTERFYRVDEGRDAAQPGAGLGLAIVKHVMERHEGELRIDSQPGRGSEFTCLFPPERSG